MSAYRSPRTQAVTGYRRGEVKLTLVGHHQGRQRRHGLGGGVDVDDGVTLPGPKAGAVGGAAPDVDHRPPCTWRRTRPHVGAAGRLAANRFRWTRRRWRYPCVESTRPRACSSSRVHCAGSTDPAESSAPTACWPVPGSPVDATTRSRITIVGLVPASGSRPSMSAQQEGYTREVAGTREAKARQLLDLMQPIYEVFRGEYEEPMLVVARLWS